MRHRDLVSQMFPEVIQCLPIPVLEIKKSELYMHQCPFYLRVQRVVVILIIAAFDLLHCSGLPLPSQLRTRKTRPNRTMYPAF